MKATTNTNLVLTRDEFGDALFAFPIQVVKATEEVEAKFERGSPDGNPVKGKTTLYDAVNGKVLTSGDVRRGVFKDGTFYPVADAQIKEIDKYVKIDAIEVVTTLEAEAIPSDRVEGRYYLQAPPESGSHHAYKLVYESLKPQAQKGQGKRPAPALALLVKYPVRDRVKLGVIYADEGTETLTLLKLAYSESLRTPDATVLAPQTLEVEEEDVALCRKVVEGLENPSESVDSPTDEAIAIKRELIDTILTGDYAAPEERDEEKVEAPSGETLTEKLKASLA